MNSTPTPSSDPCRVATDKVMPPLNGKAVHVSGPEAPGLDGLALHLPDLAELADEIHEEHALAGQRARVALEHAALAGELLLQARVQMPQAQWRLWLEEACAVPEEMAHTYMGLAQALPGQKPALVPYVAQGSLRGVLEELTAAVPERERRRQSTEAWEAQIAAMTAQLPPLERALDEAADVFRLLQLQQQAVALQSRAAACHRRCRQEAGRLLKALLVNWSSVHGALDPEERQALSALLEEAQGQPPADEALAASDASRSSCEAPAAPTSPEEDAPPLPEDP